MRVDRILLLFLFLGLLPAQSAADSSETRLSGVSSMSETRAAAASLELSDAIDMIERSASEQARLLVKALKSELDIRATYGPEWTTAPEAQPALEALQEQLIPALSAANQDMTLAGHRLFGEASKEELVEVFSQLSDRALAAAAPLLQLAQLDRRDTGNALAIIRQSPGLQIRLEQLLANDSLFLDVDGDPQLLDSLVAAGTLSAEDAADLTIAGYALIHVLQALPQARTERLMSDIIAGRGLAHLQKPMRSLATSGILRHYLELSPEWVAAQVRAGNAIWLPYLADLDQASHAQDLPALMAGLTRAEQLSVIANNADPALYSLLTELHGDILLELSCPDCPHQPGDGELRHLIEAAVRMPIEATDALVWALLDALPAQQQEQLARLAYQVSIHPRLPERLSFSGELLSAFPEIDIRSWQLRLWPGEDAKALEAPFRQRLDAWQQQTLASRFQGQHLGRDCDALAMLLFAHGHGWFDQWQPWAEQLTEAGLAAQAVDACLSDIAELPVGSGKLSMLNVVIDFFDFADAGADHYQSLISAIRHPNNHDMELFVAATLGRLEENGRLETLSEDQLRWLLADVNPSPRTTGNAAANQQRASQM